MVDDGYHHTRCGNEPHTHGVWCGHRNTGSTSAVERPKRDSSIHFRTKQEFRNFGSSHPVAVGGTTAEDSDNDAGYAAAICCCATTNPPRLLKLWILRRKKEL